MKTILTEYEVLLATLLVSVASKKKKKKKVAQSVFLAFIDLVHLDWLV